MSSNNVNLITIGSIVIGTNLPLGLRQQEKPDCAGLELIEAEEQALEGVELSEPEEEEAPARPCVWRALARRIIFVAVIAWIFCRCRKMQQDTEAIG